MRCLKGVILKTRKKWALVKLLTTGVRFWVASTPTSRCQCPVLVAWDYVRHEPHAIYTEDDWNTILGKRETEIGVFSIPLFLEVENDQDVDFTPEDSPVPPTDFWWLEEGTETGVDGDFSIPLIGGTDDGVSEDHHNYY